MNKIIQSPSGASNESEIDGSSSIGLKNDLILSAKALLSAHNTRNGSNGSLDSNCIAESSSVLSSFSMNPDGLLPNFNTSFPKKKGSKIKESAVKKQREVIMSYKINCVSDISAILCTVEVDLKVFFHWCDDALIGRKNGTTIIASDEKGLFDPDIVISNEHNISEISSVAKVTNSETGEVKCSKHYKGTVFLTSMDLRLFPFDCQNLQICFKPYKKSIEEVIMIRSDPAECAMESRIAHEWDILGHCMKVFETDPLTSSTKKVYSTIYLTVLTRRKAGWFVANIFVPTFLMLVVSWLTFIYEPHGARSDRNDVSMSTLLLSISNKFVVGDAMPKVDYRTLVDIYVDTCFYLQVLTMLANAVVEKYQDMPFLGAFGRHLNLSFFLLELIAAFCLHEWFFVSLWNHRADILDWVEASKDKDSELEVPGHGTKVDIDYADAEHGMKSVEKERDSVISSPKMMSPRGHNHVSMHASFDGVDWPSAVAMNDATKDTEGIRQRRKAKISIVDNSPAPDDIATCSTGSSSPGRRDGTDTPPYMGYMQSNLLPLEVDFIGSPPSNGSSSFPTLSPLMKGIMLQRDMVGLSSTSFSSSTSSFFSTAHANVPIKQKFPCSEKAPEVVSPALTRTNSKETYKTRPRRVSSVSTLLVFIERVTGPASSWVGTSRHHSSNGAAHNDERAVRRISSPHFTDFGSSGVTPVVKGSSGIIEARRLQSNMTIERANVVSEMFKRTISRAGLKEALALRHQRKIERAKEIERLESELKPSRGSSISSYFGSAKASPEERRKIAGIHYAQWEENEETFIRNMAAKVLQQRWRMMRGRRQLKVLNGLRDQALLEGYAARIQRTFRLRRMLRTIKQNRNASKPKEQKKSA